MSVSVGGITIEMAANIARLQSDMADAKKAVGGAMGGMSDAVDVAKKAFIALGGVVAVGGFVKLISGSIDAAGALNDLSIKTGASVESLSKFGDVGRLSGVSAEQIGDAMNKLAKGMVGATEESKGVGQAIKALGLDFDDFRKLSPDDQMLAVSKAMEGFADGSGKSAAAMALFGKTGADLLPFMADLANAGELQARITTEQAAAADEFGDNMEKLKLSSGAMVDTLVGGMTPALAEASDAFVAVFAGSGGLRDQLRGLVADGTIAEWTRGAVTGLTYVMDAVTGVWRTFRVLGEYIGGSVAAFAAAFSAIGGAATKAFSGDFKGAIAEAKTGVQQWNQITSAMGANISEIWSEQTMGQQIRARMKDVKDMGAAAQAAKPQLDLSAPIDKTTKAAKAEKEAVEKLVDIQEIEIGILKALKAEHDKQLGAVTKETAAIREQIDKQREANDAMRYTSDELAILEIKKINDAAATAERNALLADETLINGDIAEQYRQQAAGLKELAGLKSEGIHLRAAQEAAAEWQKTSDSISDGITDALFRAFEDGKGFGKAFRDTLENSFKTLILKPSLEFALKPIKDMIGSVFGKLNIGNNPLLQALGSTMIGSQVGDMFSGGYGSGTTTTIGAGLGTLLGGPIGGLVGGAIGGVVNRLFGRKPKKITEAGIVGEFIGGDFDGQQYANWKKKGGLFRSSKRGTDYSPLTGSMEAGIDEAGAAMFGAISDYAGILKLPAEVLAGVNHSIKVKLTEDEAENQRLIDEALAGYGDALAGSFDEALKPFREAGESVSDTLRRLAELQAFSENINSLGGVFSRIAGLGVRAKEELIGFAGGIDALLAKAQSFVQNYYSESEQLGIVAQQLQEQLAALGITSGVNSRADLRALIEAQDISTTEGRQQLDALLTIAQAFAPIGQYLEDNGTTLAALAENSPQTAILQSVLDDTEIQTEYQQRTADGVDRMNDTMLTIGDLIARAVQAMHADVGAALTAIASTSAQTSRLLDRWDGGDAMTTTPAT